VKRKISYVLLCICICVCISCSSFRTKSYKTLAVSGYIYDNAMKSVANLDKKGLLKPKQKTIIIKYGNQFWLAYNSAIYTMELYTLSETVENEVIVTEALNKVTEYTLLLTDYLVSIGGVIDGN